MATGGEGIFVISGASGFVGRRIINGLRTRCPEATVMALSRSERAPSGNVRWVSTDLAAASQLKTVLAPRLSKPAVWIHAAPLTLIGGVQSLIEAGLVARVVAIGTTSVFAKANSPVAAEQRMVSEYRTEEEALARCCVRAGIPWTLLRPTLVYDGTHDRNVAFIAACIRFFGFFPLVGQGGGRRQPLHAEDLANACLDVLDTPSADNRAYNLGGGEILTYRRMVERIFTARGRKPRIIVVPPILLKAVIGVLRLIPRYRYLNQAMVGRTEADLVFDYSQASADFGFAPRAFLADPLPQD